MHRFYLAPDQCRGAQVSLQEGEARHAIKVLRLQPGEDVVVLDGAGTRLRCRVQAVERRTVLLTVEDRTIEAPSPWLVTLLQALPKNKAFETIVQKATELGAARIVPLLSERSTVHLDEGQTEDKQHKWELIAIEASKQCGLAWLPKIEPAVTLTEYLNRKEQFDVSLVGSLQPGSVHPRKILREKKFKTVGLWIGPEGDFTADELSAITASGASSISLGPRTLRCDTAAIYGLSMVNYELSDEGLQGLVELSPGSERS